MTGEAAFGPRGAFRVARYEIMVLGWARSLGVRWGLGALPVNNQTASAGIARLAEALAGRGVGFHVNRASRVPGAGEWRRWSP